MSFLNPDPDSSDDRTRPASGNAPRPLPLDLFLPESSPADGAEPDGIDSITRRLRSSTETGEPAAAAPKPTLAATIALQLRTHSRLLGFAAVIAVLAVALFFAWPYISSGAASVQASLVSAISNAPDPDQLADAPPESAPPTPPRATGQTRRRSAQPPAPEVIEGQPRPVIEAVPVGIPATASAIGIASNQTADAASVVEPGSEALAPRQPPVYSTADADVQPPKIRSTDVPRTIGGGLPVRTESLELLVNAQGTVDRVSLRTPNPRMLDTMFLSRAKMWQFEPAQRDGVAVPYRLVMSWQVSDR
jgi:hypothetical protein